MSTTSTLMNAAAAAKATTQQSFLHIDQLSKVFPTPEGSYVALDNINLKVAEGEFVCFIGHSGCGKSTLLNMVSGFAKPSTGQG
jgi:ABC-type nitrate/sulfonate/bicarbonate transport system ATPase subunit